MINIAVCDDNDYFCENIVKFFNSKYSDIIRNIDDFTNGKELMDNIRNNDIVYDFIILDLDMPVMNGIETGNALRMLGTHANSTIIFITAFDSTVTEVVDIHPYAYIIKPIDFNLFEQKFNGALKNYYDDLSSVILTAKKNTYKLTARSIIYIESYGRKSIIHCTAGEPMVVNIKLSDIQKMVSDSHKQLVQIHKSYIINLLHIDEVTATHIHLKNSAELPLSKTYKMNFLKSFEERFY